MSSPIKSNRQLLNDEIHELSNVLEIFGPDGARAIHDEYKVN